MISWRIALQDGVWTVFGPKSEQKGSEMLDFGPILKDHT